MPRVLLAFDKFKHALSASEACHSAAAILAARHPDWELDICPLSDGGEGFSSILTDAVEGEWRECHATGARGESVEAGYGLVEGLAVPPHARELLQLPEPRDGRIAVVEMALASGIERLPPSGRDPWLAHSSGTGELLAAAAREPGVSAILLGIGGSATNDLGLGALSALGLKLHEATGERISPPCPAAWTKAETLTGSLPPSLPTIRIACDVSNPLLGPRGCTAVYGPQKGLKAEDFEAMEAAVAKMSARLCAHFGHALARRDEPGAGAAGGLGFGLRCATKAHFVPGAALFKAWTDLNARLDAADIVITGEGRFDASSLSGKGPGSLAQEAAAQGKRVEIFCGATEPGLNLPASIEVNPITPAGMPLPTALAHTERLLREKVSAIFG